VQDAIQKKMNSVKWYHRYEVLPGVWSPGVITWEAGKRLDSLGVARDLTGLKALDVGTWDGPLAFELEARGAEVFAVDVQDPDCTAFNVAKSLRGSKVQYKRMSVYDVNKVFADTKFDIITYFGVYYHLKHPILGFEALSDVLADNGKLYLEGELLINYSETETGEPSSLNNTALATSKVPLALCYTGDYKRVSNWFVPNLTCLKGWLEAAGLILIQEMFSTSQTRPYPEQRICATAIKARHLEVMEETFIFEKNLVIPEKSWIMVNKLRRHRDPLAELIQVCGQPGAANVGPEKPSTDSEPLPLPPPAKKWRSLFTQFLSKE
jgi:tRNA (mo5U34)-methyltransferase